MLPDSTTIVVSQNQVSSELGEETVILDAQAGQYYGLNEVGTTIWNLVQSPMTVAQIHKALLDAYDVTPEDCRRDLQEILQQLLQKELIKVQDAASS